MPACELSASGRKVEGIRKFDATRTRYLLEAIVQCCAPPAGKRVLAQTADSREPPMAPRIPFNKPYLSGKELEYIAEAVTGEKIAADGRFTRACSQLLETQFQIPRVLLTPSCTAALEMAAILCDLGPGDEVILPSYTFVSTANAVARTGARPVFVDIRPDTLNLDEELIEPAITPRTKAIFPVHYAGVSCEMDRILEIAARHELFVVEDAAQGVNATYRGQALGSIGHLGAYSFHETKNYVCGEGGALCVNAQEYIERAEIIREKGTNRSRFLRGMVDKYTWVDVGSSYVPSEISSAFLYAQLELLAPIAERRREIYEFYWQHFAPLEAEGRVQLPAIPAGCQSNYHMFYMILPSSQQRDGLMQHLKQQGIAAVFHYVPLHTAPVGTSLGYRAGDLPITEDLSSRLVRLPFFYAISEAQQAEVVLHVRQYLAGATRRRAA
jgi:dTDP-4-amino-4,6-dideoxygalactose transaminase